MSHAVSFKAATFIALKKAILLPFGSTDMIHNLLLALVSQPNGGLDEIACTTGKMLHHSFFAVVCHRRNTSKWGFVKGGLRGTVTASIVYCTT
jgi:hypothetical protein